MKVTLLQFTENAKELMIFSKQTRLEMSAGNYDLMFNMTPDEQKSHLEYMVNTIKSSWEFVDATFMIEGVSRAFTHQFVRNRLGSYAQQTMRIQDMGDFGYVTGPSIANDVALKSLYDGIMNEIKIGYDMLIAMGAKIEDARGVLPTNIETNIMAKFNLRALSNMMASRASSRTQSEYRDVIEAMYNAIVAEHEWVAPFLRDSKHYALGKIESLIRSDYEGTDQFNDIIKLIDQVRNA